MKFLVTREHISKGIKCNAKFCPVARSIRDKFPKAEIRVDLETLWFKNNKHEQTIKLDYAVRRFIQKFDETGTGFPFEFDLPIKGA